MACEQTRLCAAGSLTDFYAATSKATVLEVRIPEYV